MANDIASPMSIIINQSLYTGIFPEKLKIAKIIPIFKKGDPHLLENYWPISLLSAISKVFEKTVFNQVYTYFTENKLFYRHQYGFRKLHSTEYATIEFVDQIYQLLDKGKLPLAIFIDLSKAFDTLNHGILIKKLNYYGLTQTPLKWFKSYLENRKQYTQINGVTSSLASIDTGVPQGSILGPLLFIIYINDIYTASPHFEAILYADDTSLITPLCSFTGPTNSMQIASASINYEIQKLQTWLNTNKLSLNVSKTKFMLFHYPQRKVTDKIPVLQINNEKIEHIEEFNFLGLTIDSCLNWKAHTQKIANKISRTLGVMNRIENQVPKCVLKMLYNSLVLPHMQYAILTWGFKLGRLNRLQKRAVRIISGSKYNSHTEPLFKKAQMLKLRDIFEINLFKIYHKFSNDNLPFYLKNMLKKFSPQHGYETRTVYILVEPESYTPSAKNCLRYELPMFINKKNRCCE